jgi:hypothetical protein
MNTAVLTDATITAIERSLSGYLRELREATRRRIGQRTPTLTTLTDHERNRS